ncbi:MAG: hypothetical protein ACYDCC_15590 [Actinomycetota bacterium]
MIVFPIIATVVSAVFSFALFRQSRGRLAQFAWGVSLAMYAVASLAVVAGLGSGWDPTLYRAFWLFGALLNVPWLALGSIALLGHRIASIVSLLIVVAASVFALIVVMGASLNKAALDTKQIPTSKPIFCTPYVPPAARNASMLVNPLAPHGCDEAKGLAQFYSIPPFLIVVGIAFLSARRRRGVRQSVQRVRGNFIIAGGVTVNAVGGFALIGHGHGAPFSIILAISVITMFIGFMMASRAPKPVLPDTRVGEA